MRYCATALAYSMLASAHHSSLVPTGYALVQRALPRQIITSIMDLGRLKRSSVSRMHCELALISSTGGLFDFHLFLAD